MDKTLFYIYRTNMFFEGDLREVLETVEEAIQNHKSYRFLAERLGFDRRYILELMLEPIDVAPNTKVIACLMDLGGREKDVVHMIIG